MQRATRVSVLVFFATGLALMLASQPGMAQESSSRLQGFAQPKEHPVRAQLISEHTTIQPGGSTRVGIFLQMEDGWHIYAADVGDAGLATRVIWVTPAQMTVRPLAWPQPQEFLDPGDIRTFGYEDAVVLASTVTLAASGGEPSPTLLVQADVQWLACRDICIPGSASLVLPLGVSADQPAESPQAELFRQHGTY